jgi:hypothetical protein
VSVFKLLTHVYVVMGIDEYEDDRVLAVCATYEDAKKICIKDYSGKHSYHDLWIDKHELSPTELF